MRNKVAAFVERKQIDELILAISVSDHQARKRGLEIAAEVLARLN